MATDRENWQSYIKQNPKNKIVIEEKYLLNNREIVSSKYLQQIWGVTDKTIRNYLAQGMPYLVEQSSARFRIFDLLECIAWRMESINMSKSNVSKVQQKESESEDSEGEVFRANREKIIADAKKATHESNIAEIKEKVARGEYISAKDSDRDKATQALMHISELYNDRKILPTMLADKTKEKIIELLVNHHKTRITTLQEVIEKEYDCDEDMYAIVAEVIEALKKESPKQIINRISR